MSTAIRCYNNKCKFNHNKEVEGFSREDLGR